MQLDSRVARYFYRDRLGNQLRSPAWIEMPHQKKKIEAQFALSGFYMQIRQAAVKFLIAAEPDFSVQRDNEESEADAHD